MAVFGLIDGNSFYCSAERAFQPELRGKPLIVLSNNDGCAIARTAEAKALGIKMGDPFYKLVRRPEMAALEWRSSNYALYGDMSRRVYETLLDHIPQVEVYSIDEMFMDLDGLPVPNLVDFCRQLRDEVRRLAKIPTCVGIGPTKTIAKLGNKVAKSDASLAGVCDLRDHDARQAVYQDLPVSEVWGIGGQATAKLDRLGVTTIADFIALPGHEVRQALTVVGQRTWAELRGISCMPLSLMPAPKQGITVSRSFGSPVTTWPDLREAMATYTTRAAEKLRSEGLEAHQVAVFCHTNRFVENEPQYSGSRSTQIEPTSYTPALIAEAARLLKSIWRPGFRYSKAGIMLNDLRPAGTQAAFLVSRDPIRSAKAMAAMDALNARFGRGTVQPASVRLAPRPWSARQERISSRYTTKLEEILIAKTF